MREIESFAPTAPAGWSPAFLFAAGKPAPQLDRPPVEQLLSTLLDEVDFGVILLGDDTQIVFANHAAKTELRDGAAFDVIDGRLRPRLSGDRPAFAAALAGARRGIRRLAKLGGDSTAEGICAAVIPVQTPMAGGLEGIAVIFGRRRLCEPISMLAFARAHGLTPAESKVLEHLCQGLDPADIAHANRVGLTTIRTQINSIRDKTGAPSIRSLIQQVAMLPPMVAALRC